ncbi:MAG TPA: D-aminoacyl-tRNA deacylase [Chlamydiales bacterium]|nr:D-aminoacyl-tRNA deacylase [Chlamydiales bacterium]
MKILVQRVKKAKVVVENETVGEIQSGALVFLGVAKSDISSISSQISYLANKLVNLRMFTDDEGKMNLSLMDLQKEILVVSQFTLYGDCSKGRRPSFIEAMEPEEANSVYLQFVEELKKSGLKIATGKFQAKMEVSLVNDGPVTFMIEGKF